MASVVSNFGAFACAPALAKVLATRHAKDICKNLLVIEVLPGRFLLFLGPRVGSLLSGPLERTG
jgi:hypothetical protein